MSIVGDPEPTVAAWWQDLVTAALLGTDRREPPLPPHGPLADLVADAQAPTPAARLLVSVAAAVVARRAGMRPGPAVTSLAPPPADPRPVVPADAVETWRSITTEHPVLLDEWLGLVVDHGWRLAPDVAVDLLRRTRNDADRHRVVRAATGPLADWLVDQVPSLAPGPRRGATAGSAAPPPVPAELTTLLDEDADAVTVRRGVVAELTSGRPLPVVRPVLTNVIARCRPEVLPAVAAGLRSLDSGGSVSGPVAGAAWVLADLAATRARMRRELDPALRVGADGDSRPS
jgi:hypothetical protein